MKNPEMHIVIEIKTPKGSAKNTSDKISWILLPKGIKNTIWTNQADDTIYWEVKDTIKSCLQAQRNVAMFDKLIQNVFNNRAMREFGIKKLSKEQQKELKEMLENHTTVKIIKAEQLNHPADGKTWWERIKEKFQS